MENRNEELLSKIDEKYKILYETSFSMLSDTVSAKYEGKDVDVIKMRKIRALVRELSFYGRYKPELLF